MKYLINNVLLSALLLIGACKDPHKALLLSIDKIRVADSLPSGSGIVISNDSAYIVGDDATAIYKISIKDLKWRKIDLPGYDPGLYRIPKAVKHDYESAAIVKINNTDHLLAFGSGTISPLRDSLLIIDLSNEKNQRKVSLTSFYKKILEDVKLSMEYLNIEGAAVSGNDLYLFNRGNNMIFAMKWQAFSDYIITSSSKNFPLIKKYPIELPGTTGIPARFSGACTLGDKKLLFTASLEDTKNWIEDGEILGSYIGILNLEDEGPQLDQTFLLKDANGAIKVKLESLDVISASDDKIVAECIADNDDGSSSFFTIQLKKAD